MDKTERINGIHFAKMIQGGCENLRSNAQAINDLNVFPIPDGDTGDNMLLTMIGGANAVKSQEESLSQAARRIADGMLLSARGNSGVILSQFFDGIADGFEGIEDADDKQVSEALCEGVRHAYNAVMEPCEGTILTVAKCSAKFAAENHSESPEDVLRSFISEGKRTLDKTPEMLPVLKKAGVVDSGGAGLLYIAEGMLKGLNSDSEIPAVLPYSQAESVIDIDLFDENSILEYGYCTELLLRLQNTKTDPLSFQITTVTDYLKTIGDSVAAVKTGTLVKLHVHTMTPHLVLSFCQQFGEFLKVKIENMSLQHNNTDLEKEKAVTEKRKAYGVVAACSGDGIKELFMERGADLVIDGGQSMNPSCEDFLNAFDKVNADVIFVYPNNSNVILTANQAAQIYEKSDIRVIESRNIGEGYSSLSMLCTDCQDADTIEKELTEAMLGVVTAEISQSVRDIGNISIGDYIGFVGKDIISQSRERIVCAYDTVDKLPMSRFDICILIYGKDVSDGEARFLVNYIERNYPGKEIFTVNGMQDIYDYILILE